MSKIKDMKARLFPSDASFTLKELLGYTGGLFGNTMGQDCVYTYSVKFNRDFMGLKADKQAGVKFDPNIILGNAATILSFLVPPIAGAVVDRPADKKGGGSRPILGLAPIPFAIASLLLFVVPARNLIFRIIYTFILTLLFNTVDTFYDMALNAISIRMTTNPKDRKNFYTLAELAGTLGSMLPGWLLPVIVGLFKEGQSQKWAYFMVALIFCVLGVSTMYAPFFTLKEKVFVRSCEKQQEQLSLKYIMSNRPLLILLTCNFLETVRQVTYDYLPYLYQNTFDNYGMKAIIEMISGGLSYAGLAIVPLVGKKISSRTMMSGGYLYSAVFYGIMSLFNLGFSVNGVRKFKWLIGVLIGMSGMSNMAMRAAKRILIADSTEYMEWKTYKKYGIAVRSEGMVLAASGIVSKASALLRTNLYNGSLNKIGYQSAYQDASGNTVYPVQSDKTLHGIFLITTLFGFIGNFLPAIVMLFDNYTGKRKEEILEELREIRIKSSAVPETV